ncbi:Cation efflux system protein CusF precursor [Variovorax sp. PBS-H4]|nr:Cation efflux system protein CusF precursor [Variovorax sp. PBS-H4]
MLAFAVVFTAAAQSGNSGSAPAADAPASADAALTDGEVRKVDKEGKKLTLRHGPLKNLDMPAMTMVFRVGDEAMLDKVHAGDKVRFQAEKIDGKFTVTRLDPTR